MDELVHALEGRHTWDESRIATARWNLVGDDATPRSEQACNARETVCRIWLMHQKPAHVCQIEGAWRAQLCRHAGAELPLNERYGAVALLSEDQASSGQSLATGVKAGNSAVGTDQFGQRNQCTQRATTNVDGSPTWPKTGTHASLGGKRTQGLGRADEPLLVALATIE